MLPGGRSNLRPLSNAAINATLRHGAVLVLLLCAGDKRTQSKDVEHACDYWKDYQARR